MRALFIQIAESIKAFNWWKRPEVKPLPKSRFPIRIKIDQTPANSSGTNECSMKVGDNHKATDSPIFSEIAATTCPYNEGERNS